MAVAVLDSRARGAREGMIGGARGGWRTTFDGRSGGLLTRGWWILRNLRGPCPVRVTNVGETHSKDGTRRKKSMGVDGLIP